jgi:hypothetical protein
VKPYHQIPIKDCGERLIAIPTNSLSLEIPHPYIKLGAEYGNKSPYYLRQGVVQALLEAQFLLEKRYPGWKIKVYDAYRPVGVQQYMVNYTFNSLVIGSTTTRSMGESLSTVGNPELRPHHAPTPQYRSSGGRNYCQRFGRCSKYGG